MRIFAQRFSNSFGKIANILIGDFSSRIKICTDSNIETYCIYKCITLWFVTVHVIDNYVLLISNDNNRLNCAWTYMTNGLLHRAAYNIINVCRND